MSAISNLASSVAAQLAHRISESIIERTDNSIGSIKSSNTFFQTEFPINDFSPSVRRKATASATCQLIKEATGVTILVKGKFSKPDEIPDKGRNLHLFMEGPTEFSLDAAKSMIRKIIEDELIKDIEKT